MYFEDASLFRACLLGLPYVYVYIYIITYYLFIYLFIYSFIYIYLEDASLFRTGLLGLPPDLARRFCEPRPAHEHVLVEGPVIEVVSGQLAPGAKNRAAGLRRVST